MHTGNGQRYPFTFAVGSSVRRVQMHSIAVVCFEVALVLNDYCKHIRIKENLFDRVGLSIWSPFGNEEIETIPSHYIQEFGATTALYSIVRQTEIKAVRALSVSLVRSLGQLNPSGSLTLGHICVVTGNRRAHHRLRQPHPGLLPSSGHRIMLDRIAYHIKMV